MNNTLVSLLMPVKDSEKYISLAIRSIINQTYRNLELIIIDASRDNTEKKIKEFNDNRIKHIKDIHGNLSTALNKAITLSSGEYIARMDGDDISDSTRIEQQYNYINKYPETDVVGTNYTVIDRTGKKIFIKKMPELNDDIEYMMPIITSVLHPTIFTRKKVLIEAGLYREDIVYAEDTELFIRLIRKGYRFYNIQKPLYFYRISNKDKTIYHKADEVSYNLGFEYLKQYYNKIKDRRSEYDKNYRFGLLEYYKGSIKKSKCYFLKCLIINPLKLHKIFRYLILSISGKAILGTLRKTKTTQRINFTINRILKLDTNKIKRIYK